MKISEMNNEQAADALIKIATPVGNIFEDEKTTEMFNQLQEMGEGSALQNIGKILPQIVVHLLKTHKDDLYEIIGALTFQSKAKVAGMNFVETVNVVKESYDEVLHNFFTSSVRVTKSSKGK